MHLGIAIWVIITVLIGDILTVVDEGPLRGLRTTLCF
jgi:hypothetical protein